MKKRIAAFLLVMVAVLSIASSASAKAFDGGLVFGVKPGLALKK
ncbi:MAG: hypothetical protein ACOY93_00420 [Bacillota bacterium]